MMRCIRYGLISAGLLVFSVAYDLLAQKAPATRPPTLKLIAQAGPVDAGTLIDPEHAAWQSVQAQRIALNRTPRLYETERPSELEIPEIEVRLARSGGKLMVRLSWHDATEDTAKITPAPGTPTDGRFLKEPTEATNRFFDAAAVMCPTDAKGMGATPALQMGDPQDPVTIYYWNAARGPMLMDAKGRETTRRTGQSFPARASYRGGLWSVCFELPDLHQDTPLAFAIWNGSQQDRDGRKYFSVWHWLE
jgi:complex iron-sulfur molybdoenzyme family reductase subunit gamma